MTFQRTVLPRELSLAAFADRDPSRALFDLGGETMGTTWSVRFAAPFGCDPLAVETAILARLNSIVVEMSHWRPDSIVSAFNHGAPGSWHDLPDDFTVVIDTALEVARLSGGAFDPTMGMIVALRGFGPDGAAWLDDEHDIIAARQLAGWQLLRNNGRQLLQPGGLALDLSGIAKGYAVDALIDQLIAQGIDHALVEIGDELKGIGLDPDGDLWSTRIEDPPGMSLPDFRIMLHNIAVATSGGHRHGNHTIDPRDGCVITHGLRSVSVIHKSAMLADAWATALTVLGPEEGFALAEWEGLAARFISDDEQLTTALKEMLEY